MRSFVMFVALRAEATGALAQTGAAGRSRRPGARPNYPKYQSGPATAAASYRCAQP